MILDQIHFCSSRFYDVTSGVVKISGKNINDLDENWLRKNVIGFINQEPVLFATSIKENIKYGNLAASDEEVNLPSFLMCTYT